MFDPNNLTLSSVFSFQTAWLIKKKSCVSLSTFPYNLFIHFLDWIESQLKCVLYFFKTT